MLSVGGARLPVSVDKFTDAGCSAGHLYFLTHMHAGEIATHGSFPPQNIHRVIFGDALS